MTISGIAGAAGVSYVSGASAMAPPQQKMSNLYGNIDTAGSGSISQSQFNQAFQTMNPPAAFRNAGAAQVWNQLDPSGSGQVAKQDFIDGMKSLMVSLRQPASGSVAQSATASLNAMGTSTNITA